MAKFGGVVLFDPNSSSSATGAVFKLSSPARWFIEEHLSGGGTVRASPHSPFFFVSVPPQNSHSTALNESVACAQQGLDLASVQGYGDHWLPDPLDWNLVWWQDAGAVALRFTELSAAEVTITAHATVRDSQGNAPPPVTAPPHAWDESYRYFRLSQTTDDLFDSYRNLYLALESILNSIAPIQPRGKNGWEQEKVWIPRALNAVGLASLASLAPSPTTATPADDIYDDLYKDKRTALFHAKGNRAHYVPHNPVTRQSVAESHERITNLYLAIVETRRRIIRQSGGITDAGFRSITSVLDAGSRMYASVNARTEEEVAELPNAADAIPLQTRRASELDRTNMAYVVAEEAVSRMSIIPTVRQVTLLLVDGTPFMLSDLGESLDLDGVARFEVHLPLQLRNPMMPRVNFPG